MAVILFDTERRKNLYPLTYTKAIADIRFGMFTVKERWQRLLKEDVFIETEPYLQGLYPSFPESVHTWINAAVLPFEETVNHIKRLQQGDVIEDETGWIACKGTGSNSRDVAEHSAMNFTTIKARWLTYTHEICAINETFIISDFALITRNRESHPLPAGNQCLNSIHIFIEEGARIDFAIINAEKGPVYIGKNATIMEGSLLKGPLVINDHSVVKMGSKLYGATSIGHHCTVGGEIKNSVIQSYSNKAHDGYLGDSVIGEWCNLGAGVSNSNVKNTAGEVFAWNEYEKATVSAGFKSGVMMGDYTRVAINSSINTGSFYGVSCNVFGEGLLPAWLRNFSWGVNGEGYALDKAIRHIRQWKNFKQQLLSIEQESVLTYIFENLLNE